MSSSGSPSRFVNTRATPDTALVRLDIGARMVGYTAHHLVPRVGDDFTVWFRTNEVCLLLRLLCCVPVMSRS